MISLRSRQRRRSNKNHEKSEEDPLLVKQKDECYVICSTLFYYVIQLSCSVDDVLWRNVKAMPAPVLIPHNLQRPSTIIQNFLEDRRLELLTVPDVDQTSQNPLHHV